MTVITIYTLDPTIARVYSECMATFPFDPKFLKAAVYGANDGIITTFAVVAGVAGAQLSARIVLILGIANMIADGLSMGLGDYLGERSEQKMRQSNKSDHRLEGLWRTGLVTFVSFVIAGSFPLMPYIIASFGVPISLNSQFTYSIIATGIILFLVGAVRTVVTKGTWWKNGLEMFGVGAIAAVVAYVFGAVIESAIR